MNKISGYTWSVTLKDTCVAWVSAFCHQEGGQLFWDLPSAYTRAVCRIFFPIEDGSSGRLFSARFPALRTPEKAGLCSHFARTWALRWQG